MVLKTKLSLVATSTVLGAALVGGTTFALFTSSALNSSNTFQAGTLHITLDQQDPNGLAYFNIANMVPGDSQVAPVTISSTGSLALKYTLSVTLGGYLGTQGTNHLTYAVYQRQEDADNGTNPINLSQYRSLDAQGGTHYTETLYVKITLPLAAGDEYQAKQGSATIRVNAVQQAHSGITNVQDVPTLPNMSVGTVYSAPEFGGPARSGIWNSSNAGDPRYGATNGVPLIFSTVVNNTTGSLNFTFMEDDVTEIYIDGNPVWLNPYWDHTSTFSQSVTPGYHTVQFFAENTNAYDPVVYNSGNNPASLNAIIRDQNGQILASTYSPSQWSVQQPTGANINPYMFGATSQTTPGPLDPSKATYNNATHGIPIGPVTLPQ